MAEEKTLPAHLVRRLPVVKAPSHWRIVKNRLGDFDIMVWFPGQIKIQLRTGKEYSEQNYDSYTAATCWPHSYFIVRAAWKVIRKLERHERKERIAKERKVYEEALKAIEREAGRNRREIRVAKRQAKRERKLAAQISGNPYLGTSKEVAVFEAEKIKTNPSLNTYVPLTQEEYMNQLIRKAAPVNNSSLNSSSHK